MMPVLFSAVMLQRSRHDKTSKKQVAMIAQKVIDAKQPHWQRGPLVTHSNIRASALRTLLKSHSLSSAERGLVLCGLSEFSERKAAPNLSISFSIFSDPDLRTSSLTIF